MVTLTYLKDRRTINFLDQLKARNISEEDLDFVIYFLEELEVKGIKSKSQEEAHEENLNILDANLAETELNLKHAKERCDYLYSINKVLEYKLSMHEKLFSKIVDILGCIEEIKASDSSTKTPE